MPKTMQKGFTLIETLVAIFVLTLGVVATSAVTQRNLQSSFYARDQVVAYFLAEEAVEVLGNIRDTSVLRGGDWLLGFEDAGVVFEANQTETVCVDAARNPNPPAIVPCPPANNNRLKFNPASGGYGYTTGTNWATSRYVREIRLKPVITGNEVQTIEVQVTITWSNTLASNKSITIYKTLYRQ